MPAKRGKRGEETCGAGQAFRQELIAQFWKAFEHPAALLEDAAWQLYLTEQGAARMSHAAAALDALRQDWRPAGIWLPKVQSGTFTALVRAAARFGAGNRLRLLGDAMQRRTRLLMEEVERYCVLREGRPPSEGGPPDWSRTVGMVCTFCYREDYLGVPRRELRAARFAGWQYICSMPHDDPDRGQWWTHKGVCPGCWARHIAPGHAKGHRWPHLPVFIDN